MNRLRTYLLAAQRPAAEPPTGRLFARAGLAAAGLWILALTAVAAQKGPLEREYSQPPAALTVRLSAAVIATADRLTLELRVTAPEDYAVEFPALPEKLGEFATCAHDDVPPALIADGRLQWLRRLVLEPFLPGDYQIPAFKISFGPKAAPTRRELASEPLDVKVLSVLPLPQDQNPEPLREIAAPYSLPSSKPWLAALTVGGLLALAAIIWLIRGRARPAAAAPAIPPHELALARLRELAARNLLARGEVKLYHEELSDILRRYLEGRFGLHAPEQTTEEFLAELRFADNLHQAQKDILGEFLRHCDLVKFAAYQPAQGEIDGAFSACRRLVEETRPPVTAEKEA